jgi:hypothetical protein
MFQSLPETTFVGPGRARRLLADLVWDDGEQRIVIPAGFLTDFYSVMFLGKLVVPTALEQQAPAILHDYLFVTQQMSLWSTDTMLLKAMAAGTVDVPNSKVNWLQRRGVMLLRLGSWMPWNRNKILKEEDIYGFYRKHGLDPADYVTDAS